MIRAVCVAALAACAAAQSISEIDAEISRLTALRTQHARRQVQPNPQLVTEEDNLHVRLPRQGTLTVERRQTISVADISERLFTIENTALPAVAAAAQVDARDAAFNATLTLMGSQTTRIDGLVGTMAGMQASVAAQLETINAASSVAMSTMLSTSTAQMSTMAAQNTEQMRVANSTMVSNMALQQAMISTVVGTMNASVNAAVSVAASAGSPTVYVQWGRKACTAPSGITVRKFYDGFAWGSRHDQSGGGANVQCLKNEGRGRQGSSPNDASDLIVPLRKEYSQYTGVSAHAARNGYNVPCSKCEHVKACYMESGTASCASGYLPFYRGFFYGGQSWHGGVNNRICVDKDTSAGEYNRAEGSGGHIYPTVERSNVGSRSRNPSAVTCLHCCKR